MTKIFHLVKQSDWCHLPPKSLPAVATSHSHERYMQSLGIESINLQQNMSEKFLYNNLHYIKLCAIQKV